MKILLAEEDRKLGKTIQEMLRRQDIETDWVLTGDEAWEFSHTQSYAVIMLEWLLPGRSSLQVCRSLREEGYGGGIRIIQLTSREFQLLDLLVQNYGRILPKDLIMDRMWGLGSDVSPNNLEAWIRLLQKKVEYPDETKLIHNVRGIGYKLEVLHGTRNCSNS